MSWPRCWSTLANILAAAGDGVFSEEKDGKIVLVDLKSGANRTLVSGKDIIDVSDFSAADH